MEIKPIKIAGIWDEGWILDKHILKSTPIGENAYGYMEYDTERTKLGEQVFLLKYRGRIDAVDKIMDLISPFLDRWEKIKDINTIIPVPPSKKDRIYQPTFELAYAIAKYTHKSYVEDVLIKLSAEESKNLDMKHKNELIGSIVANKHAKKKNNVLVVDDLYSSGSTIEQCVKELRKDDNIDKIYVLVMTKTRR